MDRDAGDGNDSIYVFGNSSVLNLNADDGDDTFSFSASLQRYVQRKSGDAGPVGKHDFISYRANAPGHIDGGSATTAWSFSQPS